MPRGATSKSRDQILNDWNDKGLPIGVTSAGTPMPALVDGDGHLQMDMLSGALSVGDVQVQTIGGATPRMDAADLQGVSVYGATAASTAGRTSMLTTATGEVYVWLASALNAIDDDVGVTLIAGVTPTMIGGAQQVALAAGSAVGLAAGEFHIGEIGASTIITTVTLIANCSPFASGDVLSDAIPVAGAMRVTGGKGILQSVTVIDRDDQAQAMDVVVMQDYGLLGVVNAAATVADASAQKILGIVEVAASDYFDLGNSQVATVGNVGLVVQATTGTTSLHVGAITRGAPTLAATYSQILKLGWLRD